MGRCPSPWSKAILENVHARAFSCVLRETLKFALIGFDDIIALTAGTLFTNMD